MSEFSSVPSASENVYGDQGKGDSGANASTKNRPAETGDPAIDEENRRRMKRKGDRAQEEKEEEQKKNSKDKKNNPEEKLKEQVTNPQKLMKNVKNLQLFMRLAKAAQKVQQVVSTALRVTAAVAQARAAVNRAKVNLGFCTITASVSGVIGEIPVRVGDQVSPMSQLTMLSGNTTMYAEFSVTEAIVEAMVQSGLKADEISKYIANLPEATFVMKNGTEYPYKGRVISLTGVVNAATGSLTCKVSFPNPDGHLYSGIQGTIVMPFAEKDVIIIPQFAVVRLQDKSQVFKVKADSTATAVDVTTEDTGNGKDFIVTSGLNVGDKIVTVGANNVTEGQKVLFPKEEKSEK